MRFGYIGFTSFEFPGRAGELQRKGARPALIRELGDNYDGYHEHLVSEWVRLGGPPERDDFDSPEEFHTAYEAVHDVAIAEALLRTAALHRRKGRALDAALDTSVPVVDEHNRLVGISI